MNNYMIIARIKGVDYLSKVEAESEYNAEHKVLMRVYAGNTNTALNVVWHMTMI